MERFATLRPLTSRRRNDIGDTLHELAGRMAGTEEKGRVQLRLVGLEDEPTFTVELGAKRAKSARGTKAAARKRDERPDLEIVTHAETWSCIAEGTLSPLDAFLSGRLFLRGDAYLAKRLVRHLASEGGIVDVCH